jgi:pyochelin biosynthesis protein PchC
VTSAALRSGQWIRRFHPVPGAAPRLVCFPHAGGAASYYFPVSLKLHPQIEVLAVQYPGRQDRRHEPLVESIVELAHQVADALGDEDLDGSAPPAFFGHSMGALVAFEVARILRERGGPGPARLFVSGRRAPSRYRATWVHRRDDAGFIEELRLLGGTDERFLNDPEIRALTLGTTRSDYRAVELYEYVPGEPLDCPISVLVGESDPHSTLDDARAWSEHTTAETDLRAFPGGHFYLDDHADEVISVIRAAHSADVAL